MCFVLIYSIVRSIIDFDKYDEDVKYTLEEIEEHTTNIRKNPFANIDETE